MNNIVSKNLINRLTLWSCVIKHLTRYAISYEMKALHTIHELDITIHKSDISWYVAHLILLPREN